MNDRELAANFPFDIQPLFPATVGDLDTDLFCRLYLPSALPVDILEQNNRSTEQQLTAMRFMSIEPPSRPTVLGILAVGKDPREFLPR